MSICLRAQPVHGSPGAAFSGAGLGPWPSGVCFPGVGIPLGAAGHSAGHSAASPLSLLPREWWVLRRGSPPRRVAPCSPCGAMPRCWVSGEADRTGGRKRDPSHQALPGLARAVRGRCPWPAAGLCGLVTQVAIMWLFLRVAKAREGFSPGRIMQVSTEKFFKSFFVLSQNTEAGLFP